MARAKRIGWASSTELLAEIQDAHQRLVEGDSDAAQAHAEARLLATAAKVIGIQLEHAKLTKRFRDGDTAIPEFGIKTAA